MLGTRWLILLLIIQSVSFAQNRSIHGKIIDYSTNKPIEGVKVTSTYIDSTVLSDKNGKFRFGYYPSHDDTLYFNHENYYSNICLIPKANNIHSKRIKLLPFTELKNTSINSSQNYEIITGIVVEQNSGFPVSNANVIADDDTIVTTNDKGKFSGVVPLVTSTIIIEHPEFETKSIDIVSSNPRQNKVVIDLRRTIYNHRDTLWLNNKNLIGIAVNEVVNKAIGIRYQRFFNSVHGIGIHASFYINSEGYNYNVSGNDYNGIKLAPYYRLYTDRKKRNGGYFEGKIIGSYFDFSRIWYGAEVDNRDGSSYKDDFYSFGIGVGYGYYNFFPKSNHLIFNIYGGFQLLPFNAPQNKWSPSYGELQVHRGGWYFYGPGSLIELKLIISGVF